MNTSISPRLCLNQSMRQAFHVLQMGHLELAEWLNIQIEQNPALEYDESSPIVASERDFEAYQELDFEKSRFEILDELDENFRNHLLEEELSSPALPGSAPSLFETLMAQAREVFHSKEALAIAENIIGNLDERGFYTFYVSEREESILTTIQTFDPPGIAARSLRESLLLQLKDRVDSIAYVLIRDHYETLLSHEIKAVCKNLNLSSKELRKILNEEILTLSFSPARIGCHEIVRPVRADLFLSYEEGTWRISFAELPTFHINPAYPTTSTRWLTKMLEKREETLQKIARYLIDHQGEFLRGESSTLKPMTMQQLAFHSGLHPSTIVRAVSHKYVECPCGLLALRSLFSVNQNAKKLLQELIDKENRARPDSDLVLSKKISQKGICCSRRTVAKYRKQLNIPPAVLRRW